MAPCARPFRCAVFGTPRMRPNDTLLVGSDWVLVQSDRRARVTLVPSNDAWLTYYSAEHAPPKRTLSIKLPAQSRSSFATRSPGEGLWVRTDEGAIAVAVDRERLLS